MLEVSYLSFMFRFLQYILAQAVAWGLLEVTLAQIASQEPIEFVSNVKE